MLTRCDALDGATDGLIQDSRARQRAFNFQRDVPTCSAGRDGSCLSQAQKAAIEPIFKGATTGTHKEWAMGFMKPPNATDMNAVRRRGAKMIVYHGVSDAIFSVADTEAWYRGIGRSSGGRAEEFARLYPVLAMGHCSGGPSTDQADFLSPLVAWVEQSVAPSCITAQARGAGNSGGVNADVPANWSPTRTRPLCPFPSVARYKGTGDAELASNWACAASAAGKD